MSAASVSNIILDVFLTEKSNILLEKGNVYAFKVSPSATKASISNAIKTLFGVEPKQVNVVNYKSRAVSFKRVPGNTAAFKKAYVYLNENDKIDYSKLASA